MMKFRAACTMDVVEVDEDATELDIYKACVKLGLLRNQTFSALIIGAYDNMITVDRKRDKVELLTLNRIPE